MTNRWRHLLLRGQFLGSANTPTMTNAERERLKDGLGWGEAFAVMRSAFSLTE
jgi:hypothetical protein